MKTLFLSVTTNLAEAHSYAIFLKIAGSTQSSSETPGCSETTFLTVSTYCL
jgi:hypothetical protein